MLALSLGNIYARFEEGGPISHIHEATSLSRREALV
jgi:hypothetical protein